MLKIDDKLKYVKAKSWIDIPLGTVLTVTDIVGTSVACTGDYKVGGKKFGEFRCLMSYDEIEKYFEKVINEPVKTEWTEWKEISGKYAKECIGMVCGVTNSRLYITQFCDKYLSDLPTTDTTVLYTTNQNQVKVMLDFGDTEQIISSSRCNTKDGDAFVLERGIGLALLRCFVKNMQRHLDMVVKDL